MIAVVLFVILSIAKGLAVDVDDNLFAIVNEPNIRSLLQNLSTEKLLFTTLQRTLLEPNVTDRPHLTKECVQDLRILINGIRTAAGAMVDDNDRTHTIREIDSKLIIPVMDSSAKLGSGILRGHISFAGSFEQCKAVDYMDEETKRRIRGGYFRIFLRFPFGNKTVDVNWDVCLPSSCTGFDLHSALGTDPDLGKIVVAVTGGYDKVPEYVASSYIIGSIMVVVILLCIITGAIDYFSTNVRQLQSKGRWYDLLMCFSFYSNFRDVFSTDAAKKPGQIATLNCIRAVSMIWIIMGHSFVILLLVVDNPIDLIEASRTYYGNLFSNSYLAVDSFFFLAGVLVAFLKFKDIRRNPSALSLHSWLMFYVHRILRISPAYYMLILFYAFIYTSWLYDMPAYLNPGFTSGSCRENWWINFLFLNNFIEWRNMCFAVSWYMATDLQIYMFSPLLILPFAYFGTFVGVVVAICFLLISTGLNIFQVFYFHLPPSGYQFGPMDPRLPEKDSYTFWIYQMPYIRCQVFIIGMLLGYFLEKKKTIRISRSMNLIMWLVAFVSMSIALFGAHDWMNGHQWEQFPRAMYSAFSRPLWALGISWIVTACYYGYGGVINTAMSSPIWLPIARLSFCAYLLHILVAGILFGIDHGVVHFSGVWNMLIQTCLPIAVFTFAFASLWSCAFELPFAKLEMQLFARKRKAPLKEKEAAQTGGAFDAMKTRI